MAIELVQRHQDASTDNMPTLQWETELARKYGCAQEGHSVKQPYPGGTLHETVNEEFGAARKGWRSNWSCNGQYL